MLADVDDRVDDEHVLVRSDRTGTMQLYELDPDGRPCQLTALEDPVSAARYVPGARRAVIGVDAGGDEHHQVYLIDLDRSVPATGRADLEALTAAPAYGHQLAGVSPLGNQIAYLSNRRNGVDFDLWVCELQRREHRIVYAEGGWCQPSSGYSPDGRVVAIGRPGRRPLDVGLLLVDVATGEWREVLPHPDEAALVGAPAWVDDSTFYLSSNVGRDLAGIVRYDLASGQATPLGGAGDEWDADVVSSADGQVLLVVENRNGANGMRVFDAVHGDELGEVPTAELGVVMSYATPPPKLSRDGARVYFSLSTPRRPADLWVHDRRTGESRQLTENPGSVDPDLLAPAEPLRTTAADGESIPLFVYRPEPSAAPPPAVVVVHGGPEAQAMRTFNPVVQVLRSAGYGVVVPNVRGSTGYGKRYASLDDTTKRLDSVRDLAAVHDWLEGAGFDTSRAALWGASYGGYMVLAGLAFQPGRWAAGVDIVGISDLVTFLEHTSDYRRAHREREYGSLERDRAFLEQASPLRHVDAIEAPLFVVHGRNDPRVPVSEAEQLVARLEQRGIRCDLTVYGNEGHGLSRLENRVDAYGRALAFLDDVLMARR
jgi:dipeptidyl aminopeptidase/acylaminoacyl peptidase